MSTKTPRLLLAHSYQIDSADNVEPSASVVPESGGTFDPSQQFATPMISPATVPAIDPWPQSSMMPIETPSSVIDAWPQSSTNNPALTPSGVIDLSHEAATFFSMPETVTYPGSGLVFVNTYKLENHIEIGELQYAQEYREAIIKAEHELQSHFANPVTVNLTFKLEGIQDTDNDGNYTVAGENDHRNVSVSYDELKHALQAHATTSDQLIAVSTLPTEDPGVQFDVPTAMARMLGLSHTVPADYDGEITLNDAMWLQWVEKQFGYGPDALAHLNFSGDDVVGTLEHEISEVMGRYSELGKTTSTDDAGNVGPNPDWSPLDLFRYSVSQGLPHHDYTGGEDGLTSWFSVDGVNRLEKFHNSVGTDGSFHGDLGDWDIVDPFGHVGAGLVSTLSNTDLRVMEVLGWKPASVNGLDHLTDTGAGDSIKAIAPDVLSQMDNMNGANLTDANTNPVGAADGHDAVYDAVSNTPPDNVEAHTVFNDACFMPSETDASAFPSGDTVVPNTVLPAEEANNISALPTADTTVPDQPLSAEDTDTAPLPPVDAPADALQSSQESDNSTLPPLDAAIVGDESSPSSQSDTSELAPVDVLTIDAPLAPVSAETDISAATPTATMAFDDAFSFPGESQLSSPSVDTLFLDAAALPLPWKTDLSAVDAPVLDAASTSSANAADIEGNHILRPADVAFLTI